MSEHGPEVHCPSCGAPAERGQLVCLECGARVALVYRRPPSWKVPAVIVAAVVLLLGAGTAVALASLSDDADREVAAAPPRPREAAETTAEQPKANTEREPQKTTPAEREAATRATGIVQRGALYSWPRSLEGFTVVINSTEDRGSATAFARSAAKSKPAKLGVIRAADFKTLPKGFFVVFAGYYESRGQADRATARLGGRYQGAFTQSVQR